MRTVIAGSLLLIFASVASAAGSVPGRTPASSANLLRLHPHAWQMPAPAIAPGMRFEPETGALPDDMDPSVLAGRVRRDAAAAAVRILPDGSRHAVVGGVIRAYVVATIDDKGRLVQECVHGAQQAEARVAAAAKKAPR